MKISPETRKLVSLCAERLSYQLNSPNLFREASRQIQLIQSDAQREYLASRPTSNL